MDDGLNGAICGLASALIGVYAGDGDAVASMAVAAIVFGLCGFARFA